MSSIFFSPLLNVITAVQAAWMPHEVRVAGCAIDKVVRGRRPILFLYANTNRSSPEKAYASLKAAFESLARVASTWNGELSDLPCSDSRLVHDHKTLCDFRGQALVPEQPGIPVKQLVTNEAIFIISTLEDRSLQANGTDESLLKEKVKLLVCQLTETKNGFADWERSSLSSFRAHQNGSKSDERTYRKPEERRFPATAFAGVLSPKDRERAIDRAWRAGHRSTFVTPRFCAPKAFAAHSLRDHSVLPADIKTVVLGPRDLGSQKGEPSTGGNLPIIKGESSTAGNLPIIKGEPSTGGNLPIIPFPTTLQPPRVSFSAEAIAELEKLKGGKQYDMFKGLLDQERTFEEWAELFDWWAQNVFSDTPDAALKCIDFLSIRYFKISQAKPLTAEEKKIVRELFHRLLMRLLNRKRINMDLLLSLFRWEFYQEIFSSPCQKHRVADVLCEGFLEKRNLTKIHIFRFLQSWILFGKKSSVEQIICFFLDLDFWDRTRPKELGSFFKFVSDALQLKGDLPSERRLQIEAVLRLITEKTGLTTRDEFDRLVSYFAHLEKQEDEFSRRLYSRIGPILVCAVHPKSSFVLENAPFIQEFIHDCLDKSESRLEKHKTPEELRNFGELMRAFQVVICAAPKQGTEQFWKVFFKAVSRRFLSISRSQHLVDQMKVLDGVKKISDCQNRLDPKIKALILNPKIKALITECQKRLKLDCWNEKGHLALIKMFEQLQDDEMVFFHRQEFGRILRAKASSAATQPPPATTAAAPTTAAATTAAK